MKESLEWQSTPKVVEFVLEMESTSKVHVFFFYFHTSWLYKSLESKVILEYDV